jgi:integrase
MKPLTDIQVEALKPVRKAGQLVRAEYRDPSLVGFYYIVQPNGTISYAYRFEKDGRSIKLTIGRRIPRAEQTKGKVSKVEVKLGDPMGLEHARALYHAARAKLKEGGDPAAERRGAKEARASAEANTLRHVADLFLKNNFGMKVDAGGNATFTKKRSGASWLATLERLVYPKIGNTPVVDLKRGRIILLLDEITDAKGPAMADQVLAILRAILNWYAIRNEDYTSPIVRGMAQLKTGERARDRKLSEDEIRDVWRGLDSVDECFARLVKMLLFTGCRRNEVADMKSDEIVDDLWTIPGSRYKTAKGHEVPLTPQAKALIGGRPEGFEGTAWFVFGTVGGRKPFRRFGRCKSALDAEIAKLRKAEGRPPMPRWTLHDLRRSARSLLARLKIPSEVAEKVLGHSIRGVEGTYNRHDYRDEKREALTRLAMLLESILRPPSGDNIVQFSKGESA